MQNPSSWRGCFQGMSVLWKIRGPGGVVFRAYPLCAKSLGLGGHVRSVQNPWFWRGCIGGMSVLCRIPRLGRVVFRACPFCTHSHFWYLAPCHFTGELGKVRRSSISSAANTMMPSGPPLGRGRIQNRRDNPSGQRVTFVNSLFRNPYLVDLLR